MKFFETRFDEYVSTCATHNFHPKLKTMFDKFPDQLSSLKNIIIYGSSGVGKYTQALNIVHRYSPSGLKYEKKTIIPYSNGKNQYVCKLSDIHYEVDMSLLGCNAKTLWHDIHGHIVDIIGGTPHKTGIVMCKNMQLVDHDLMETLFSYMQDSCGTTPIQLRYIFITEGVSFLPDNIVQCCETIPVPKPRTVSVKKHARKRNSSITDEGISRTINLKSLYSPLSHGQVEVFEIIVRNIVTFITGGIDNVVFSELRECIYDLFVYDANIHVCMWSVLSTLIKADYIDTRNIDVCIEYTFEFFKLYNNNYRPIYHVEAYLYKIMSLMYSQEVEHKVDEDVPANVIVSYDTPVMEHGLVKDIDTCDT
jgi:hypothetical protein